MTYCRTAEKVVTIGRLLLAHYIENGACLGALRKDLTPNPSVIALSAAARLLGDCDYLRTVDLDGVKRDGGRTPAVAVFFAKHTGGQVVVAWAIDKCDACIKIDGVATGKDVKAANIFGHEYFADAESNGVYLRLGPEAIYLLISK